MRFADDEWTRLTRVADFSRGFITLLVLEKLFGNNGVPVHVAGFGGSGHQQTRAILYHQIRAEHRVLGDAETLNVTPVDVFHWPKPAGAVRAQFPCPACGGSQIRKRHSAGRVVCMCGRTYAPEKPRGRPPRCPWDRSRGKTHHVRCNGKRYDRYECVTCGRTFGTA